MTTPAANPTATDPAPLGTAPAGSPAPQPTPQPQPQPQPRSTEAAVLDEVATLKKTVADIAAFTGFGVPKPATPPPAAPVKRAGVCWFHPMGDCPRNSDCLVVA